MVNFQDLRIILLPLVGLFALVTGGFYGVLLARLTQSTPRQKGVLFCCSSFTNIGSIGALICYMFLGEAGFALVALYKIFEEIYYYTIGFPIARYFSSGHSNEGRSFGTKPFSVMTDPFVATILTAFFTGLTLNLAHIAVPLFLKRLMPCLFRPGLLS
ncbi:AEC family transporter [Desulfopila sp. IMCC35008]|uniref:AEC family transporter n=1 Tax=Desulfopila sp. IMCC35008 TaxID=2653858 RepID=UPI0013D60CD2|nr:AEC family transporter [Desulfopila sp. IMCC35008]